MRLRHLRLGAGQQDVSAAALAQIKLDRRRRFLQRREAPRPAYFDANYDAGGLTSNLAGYVGPWHLGDLDALLTYTIATHATAAVVSAIKTNVLAG